MTKKKFSLIRKSANLTGDSMAKFAGGIAHDYNNLLAIILGNIEFVQSQLHDDRLKGLLQDAVLACKMGERMTRRLQSVAQQRQLSPRTLQLNPLIDALCSAISGPLDARWKIRLDLATDLPFVSLDESEFEAALLNVLLNALDAMPSGGILAISTRLVHKDGGPGHVSVVVADTGSGMPPHVLARALDPFYSTKSPDKGVGLGLSIVHGFVVQSGGTLEIESDVTAGTRVTLCFPALLP